MGLYLLLQIKIIFHSKNDILFQKILYYKIYSRNSRLKIHVLINNIIIRVINILILFIILLLMYVVKTFVCMSVKILKFVDFS